MWPLARAIAEITIGRRGPESLPDSNFLLGLLLAMHIAVYLVDLLLIDLFGPAGLGNLVVQEALFFAYVFAVLSFFRVERRYRRTMTALVGVDIVLYLVYFPVALIGLVTGAEIDSAGLGIVRLSLVIWSIGIGGWILARALSQPFILGFMFQLLLFITSLRVAGFFLQPAE